ncbi:MAG: radical SAM protein [Candidatus Korobacteraceae bacterium]
MKNSEALRAWGSILSGRAPAISIELTRECPLRCPGCYAYDEDHLGLPGITLRQLADFKGNALVQGVLKLVDEHRPLHVSLVGGDPLVRYRELEVILPELDRRGIPVMLVTSAFRPIPVHWNAMPRLSIAVSVDGLPAEHDVRRKPATYERILKNVAGSKVTIHCTITGQMMDRPSYLEDFVRFWSGRAETKRIWFSFFTPQQGAVAPEILTPDQRSRAIDELLRLRQIYPLLNMDERTLVEFRHPPASPKDCIFARTTLTVSADLKTRITPCQFGGTPDCSQCGCFASMGLAAVGHIKLMPGVTAGRLFAVSELIGRGVSKLRPLREPKDSTYPETVEDREVA